MKRGACVVSAVLLAAAATLFGAGCSRNRQEAVLEANKGDLEVKMNVDGAIIVARKIRPTRAKNRL